jgi:hypothetical protein
MRFVAALALMMLLIPAAAHASWSGATPLAPATRDSYALGVAADLRDRPSALMAVRTSSGWSLRLGARQIAASRNGIEGAGLFAGRGNDLVAGWLQIIGGLRRPVVATGPRLADRQMLATGPRSTQVLRLAANRNGDAVAAFWRYDGQAYAVYASYRPAGGRFQAAQLLGRGRVSNPAIAIDASGAAAVAWADPSGGHVAERAPGAAAFGAAANVPSPTRPSSDPGVGIEGGHIVVSWLVGSIFSTRQVLVAERQAAGAAFGAPVAVGAADVRIPHWITPSVSVYGGQALVAWVQGVLHTTSRDRAALAVRSGDGPWQAPILRGVSAPSHVYWVQLLGGAPGRPPILAMTTSRASRFHLLTATLRGNGTLAPSRSVATGDTGFSPWLAQGRLRAWLAADRVAGDRHQALLFHST